MARRPDFLTFGVPGAELGALRWDGIEGAPTVVAIHGITGNAWAWDPVAHQLDGDASLVAVDLRGRGRSFEAAGPFGMRQHALDIAAVIEQLDGPCLVAGHSMGAFVALMTASRHPESVSDLVLVDGGSPIPMPPDRDPDEVLTSTLGPAIDRLRKVWADRVSYYAMWASHPAFAGGIGIELERNLIADLIEVDGGFRTAVNEDAVLYDGRELLADEEVRSLLARRPTRTPILRAPFGIMGVPPPLISDDDVAALPQHEWIDVPGTNHYTVLVKAAGATVVADTIRRTLDGS